MELLFNITQDTFSLEIMYSFINDIDIIGIGISSIELNNCDPLSAELDLDDNNIKSVSFSNFIARNCQLISTDINRNDDGVSIYPSLRLIDCDGDGVLCSVVDGNI